jgi:hypothetical protein
MALSLNALAEKFRRRNEFKIFVLLVFTFAVYWLGRLSSNFMTAEYGLHESTGRSQAMFIAKATLYFKMHDSI